MTNLWDKPDIKSKVVATVSLHVQIDTEQGITPHPPIQALFSGYLYSWCHSQGKALHLEFVPLLGNC